jgi:LemA protein
LERTVWMNQLLVAVFLFGILVPAFWCISTSNRLTRLEKLVQEAWADIDVALKRRHDLVPNLVETVRAYAHHERDLLEDLVRAREEAIKGCASEESDLGRAVGAVLARAESYPELKASENFVVLQRELSDSEDRIAAARRFYNANVREFNTMLASFPARLLAGARRPVAFLES